MISIAVITLSDTRDLSNDEGGQRIQTLLREMGYAIAGYEIVRETQETIRAAISRYIEQSSSVDAVILTGGTGLAPRDVTIESVLPMFEKTMDGFGELFRSLSWQEIGPKAILSRAVAGVVQRKVVFVIPGSLNAINLAMSKLILPTLTHAVAVAQGHVDHQHRTHSQKVPST